ncbi:MAG: DUF6173 family protein [Pseudomonadota bacterium]
MFEVPMWRPTEVTGKVQGPLKGCVDCTPGPSSTAESQPLPDVIANSSPEQKTPAQWAYERLILYIQNFEKHLDDHHEVGIGLVSGGAGVMRVTGMGYFAPDLVTFYGLDEQGMKTQLVQHVTQLNVTLKAAPKQQEEVRRIGFDLSRALESDEPHVHAEAKSE